MYFASENVREHYEKARSNINKVAVTSEIVVHGQFHGWALVKSNIHAFPALGIFYLCFIYI